MVDTLVLGASAARHGGSSPLSRTKKDEERKSWRESAAFSLAARSARQGFFRGGLGNCRAQLRGFFGL